jgi:hypothetical protein
VATCFGDVLTIGLAAAVAAAYAAALLVAFGLRIF